MVDFPHDGDQQHRIWVQRVQAELIPKLRASKTVVSLVPDEGDIDIKVAVELGLSILMDKPIIAVVRPGVRIPAKLALAADHVIDEDITTPAGRSRLAEAMRSIAKGEA